MKVKNQILLISEVLESVFQLRFFGKYSTLFIAISDSFGISWALKHQRIIQKDHHVIFHAI